MNQLKLVSLVPEEFQNVHLLFLCSLKKFDSNTRKKDSKSFRYFNFQNYDFLAAFQKRGLTLITTITPFVGVAAEKRSRTRTSKKAAKHATGGGVPRAPPHRRPAAKRGTHATLII